MKQIYKAWTLDDKLINIRIDLTDPSKIVNIYEHGMAVYFVVRYKVDKTGVVELCLGKKYAVPILRCLEQTFTKSGDVPEWDYFIESRKYIDNPNSRFLYVLDKLFKSTRRDVYETYRR